MLLWLILVVRCFHSVKILRNIGIVGRFLCNVSMLLSKNSQFTFFFVIPIAWDDTSKAYLITLGPDQWARKVSSDSARFLPTDYSLTQTKLSSPMEKRFVIF